MKKNFPSVKTLREIAGDRANELRRVLECGRAGIEALLDSGQYPVTTAWYRSCYHPLSLATTKLSIASEITECHGVGYIEAGSNQKSPAIEYAHAGDPYVVTLMRVNGRYRVGCWGDIVERGNYS